MLEVLWLFVQIYNDHNRSWITYRAAHLFLNISQDLQTSGTALLHNGAIKNKGSLGDEMSASFNSLMASSIESLKIIFIY
jgi:hypothetical protein